VVVANGHFSTPNVPSFPGIETFPGRVMHSHDFRSGMEFKNLNILVVGSSYSAEDIALQTLKFGAKSVSISYRTHKMNFCNWPEGFKGQHPLIKKIEKSKVTFSDDYVGEFDAIIYCTGYQYHFPFLAPDLRIGGANTLYPPLYKGIVLPSNPQLLYMGMQDLYYSFTLFDAQGIWISQYLKGKQPRNTAEGMLQDITTWLQKLDEHVPEGVPHWKHHIDFQSEYVNDLVKITGYPYVLDCRELFFEWEKDKHANIVTYRDKQFTSLFTKKKSPLHHTKWLNAFDDSKEDFMQDKT